MKHLCILVFALFFALPLATAQQAGDLDPSFGDNGLVMTNIDSTSQSQNIDKLIWTENEKILAIGWYHTADGNPNYSDLSIVSYHESGQIDSAFGTNGIAIHNLSQEGAMGDFIRSGVVQSDGKIVCVGTSHDSETLGQIVVVRLLANGTIDSSFAENGITNFNPTSNGEEATSVQLQSDGMILVGYNAIGILPGVIRLLPTGELDLNYGENGFAFVDHAVQDILVQTDGKLLVSGEYNSQNPHWWSMGITRLDVNGNLDSEFGINGFTYFDHSNLNGPESWTTWVRSLALQGDGKIVIGGACEIQNSFYNEKFALGRLLPNGMLDTSFGTDGRVVVDLPSDVERITKVIIQPDGKIIASGYTDENEIAVIRMKSNGTLDSSFSNNGYVSFDFGYGLSYGTAGILQPDLKLLVGGPVYSSEGKYNFGIARILTDLNIGIVEFSESLSNTLVYPNPIQEQATFQYELDQSEKLTISLFDMHGKLVKTFLSDVEQPAGKHQLELCFPERLESGTYLLSISSEKGQAGVRVIKR